MAKSDPRSDTLPGLERLDERELARVRDVGREVDVPAQWSLILEDEPADNAYLLLAGTVQVRSHHEVVTPLGPGSFIGEIAQVARRPRSTTVTTLEPVRTLAFPRAEFRALRSEIPAFDDLVTGLANERLEENAGRAAIDTVVVDVDGTLVDSVYHHVAAWAQAFAEVGVTVPGWKLHGAIGMGGDRLVAAVAGQTVEDAQGDHVRDVHDRIFDDAIATVDPLPGAHDLLGELRRRGFAVTIASSGAPEQTRRLLDLVDAQELIDELVTNQDAESSKPAPDVVDIAVDRADGNQALVIGDAPWDMQAAQAQGRPGIGLLSGGFSEQQLRTAGAAHVYDDAADLLEHLDETPLRR